MTLVYFLAIKTNVYNFDTTFLKQLSFTNTNNRYRMNKKKIIANRGMCKKYDSL